jgi:acetolactate decarboxylase
VSVRWVGAQRDLLGGDIGGKIALASLADRPHLYALGPRAGVSGEVTILDGVPWIARVLDGRLDVQRSFDHEACFLVYAEVAAWTESPQPAAMVGETALEAAVQHAARAGGLSVEEPFPFLIRAETATATIHVLDKRDGLPHTPARHDQAKIRFQIDGEALDVIGFHSTRHRGVFTPGDSNLHMHLRTRSGRVSGHVEHLAIPAGAVIAVPRS